MASPSSFKRAGVIVAALVGMVGLSTVGKQIVQQMAPGSFLAQGNFVCDTSRNPNCGLVAGLYPVLTPVVAQATATGGQATYDTLIFCSPYDANAAARGFKTGTGIVHDTLSLALIKNPAQNKLDCAVVAGPGTATGSTRLHLFEDVSGTGTVVFTETGFLLGPSECVKCGTLTDPTADFSAELRGSMTYTNLVN